MLARSSRTLASSRTLFYDLLKVPKTASDEEIKKAYKAAALEHHPDRGGNSDKFKEVSHAYSVLSDPNQRAVYDQYGEAGLNGQQQRGGPSNSEDPMDIFSQVFGGAARRGGLVRGRDATYKLELSLGEIASGVKRQIAYNRDVACKSCGGRGATKIDMCKKCGGSGVVLTKQNIGFLVQMQTACPDCEGQGYRVPKGGLCSPCKGGGIVSQRETFDVNVPKGCPVGHEFRFAGKADQLPGHSAGDVIVQIVAKKHLNFVRLSNRSPDLCTKKEISLAQALGGFDLQVQTVEGKTVRLVHNGASVVAPGDVWSAPGLGLPRYEGTTNGNLMVQFSVKFPKNLTEISSQDKEKLAVLFTQDKPPSSEKNSSLFTAASGDIPLEKVHSPETIKSVAAALDPPPTQQRQQAHFRQQQQMDPQQCQQQ